MTEGDIDELSQKLAGEDVSAEEMKERLDKTEVTQHEEEALVEITELFKEMESVEGEERRKTSESIVQAAKRWPDKVSKHSEQLVDFVTDDNYYVRKNATFALGLVGDEGHVDFLEKVAEKDEDLEDVARWSAKRIQAEDGDEEPEQTDEDGVTGREESDDVEEDPVDTTEIGDDRGREKRKQGGSETTSVLDEGATGSTDISDDGGATETSVTASSQGAGSGEGSTTSVDRERLSGSDDGGSSTVEGGSTSAPDDGGSSGSDVSSSLSTDEDRSSGASSSTGGDRASSRSSSGSVGTTGPKEIYREISMLLYDQGDGHREAVEQAAVQVVSENGSLQPLVEALEGEGDEPLFAARALSRISEKEPGSLRENVSVLSDVMSRKEGEVADQLEETLVNVARETPESLVEELSNRD